MQQSKRNLPASKIGACVHYAVSVLNPDGSIARRVPRKKNLILDSGLDLVASHSWANLFEYAAVGTGTDPVRRDSGATTVSQSGTTLTAGAGFFEAGDVGRLWKFDSGEERYIISFTDTTHVEVDTSAAVAASAGTVWYVDQTGLASESKRTNTYNTDSGDNGSSHALNQWTMKRTFLFSAEAGSVTYNEIGWSYSAAGGANLFGMDIITGGVSLSAGQQLKVVVELSLSLGPISSQPWANVITGWSQDGDYCAECVTAAFGTALSAVNASGTTSNGEGRCVFEPMFPKVATLSEDTDALIAQTSADVTFTGIDAGVDLVAQAYVTGSFTRDFVGTFGIASNNSASVRSIVIGSGRNYRVFRILLDAVETKDSEHTLTLTFTLSWGRVLTN